MSGGAVQNNLLNCLLTWLDCLLTWHQMLMPALIAYRTLI
jgi:hypothetical protein